LIPRVDCAATAAQPTQRKIFQVKFVGLLELQFEQANECFPGDLPVSVTLRSVRNPQDSINLTAQTWLAILDLADLYGWTMLGAILPPGWQDVEIPWDGYDFALTLDGLPPRQDETGRLVILEDALNLADALEQAFFEYEPLRVPPSYYLFEPDDEYLRNRPSIGALTAVIDICRQGAFWIELYHR
jgi:hypothetical protein